MSDPTSSPPQPGVEVGLRWGDMDAFGHVNNVVFQRLLEEARIRAFADWFGDGGDGRLRMTLLLARQEVEFLAQLAYSSRPVRVDMWVTHIGGASWDVGYEMWDGSGPGAKVCARAESTLVAFDREAGRPRSLTPDERTALRARLGEPVAMRRRR